MRITCRIYHAIARRLFFPDRARRRRDSLIMHFSLLPYVAELLWGIRSLNLLVN